MLGSGTGEFDEERILKELPAVLSLPERRVKCLNNLLACNKVRNAALSRPTTPKPYIPAGAQAVRSPKSLPS